MGRLVRRTEVGLELAEQVLAGVREEATRQGVALGAAVVDLGGHLVAAARMDGSQLVAMPLALDKAYTAVAVGLSTATWAERTVPGQPDWGLHTALGGRLVVFAGGLPLLADGELVGGLGVSGAKGHVDEACALAGIVAAGLDVPDGPTGG